ncbi:hypothetical protein [Allobaculum sp. JKK-2023]|uniref:hypothetical protein n=1 Tax=Allobaculum sp. JKK-2023 TaxID=3108943 RepID=UPI002B05A834|nr:hypothetical protein [Allobaculum sp. JKK-2023]
MYFSKFGYSNILISTLYDGNDSLGDLMRDLRNPNPEEIKLTALREVERRLKNEQKGREIVSSTFKELLDEAVKEAEIRNTERTIQSYFAEGGEDSHFIAKVLHISVEDVEKIRNEMDHRMAKI